MDGYNVFIIVELVSFINYMLEGEMHWPQEFFLSCLSPNNITLYLDTLSILTFN